MKAISRSWSWYAIRVKSKREKLVTASLEHRGFEPFLPVYRARHRWSDWTKDVELPLFGSYPKSAIELEGFSIQQVGGKTAGVNPQSI